MQSGDVAPSKLYVIEEAPPYLNKGTGLREGGGVIAYTVDSSRWSGNDPIQLYPFVADYSVPVNTDAAIQPGQSRELENGCLTLDVDRKTPGGDFEVTVKRSPTQIDHAVTLRAECNGSSQPLEVIYRPGCTPLTTAIGRDASWIDAWSKSPTTVQIFRDRDCTGESHVITGGSENLCQTLPSPSGQTWNDGLGSVLIGEPGKQVGVWMRMPDPCARDGFELLEVLNSAGCHRLSSTAASWLNTPGVTVEIYKTHDCAGESYVITGGFEDLCETGLTASEIAAQEQSTWLNNVRSIKIE